MLDVMNLVVWLGVESCSVYAYFCDVAIGDFTKCLTFVLPISYAWFLSKQLLYLVSIRYFKYGY